jgi:hypothetical protein
VFKGVNMLRCKTFASWHSSGKTTYKGNSSKLLYVGRTERDKGEHNTWYCHSDLNTFCKASTSLLFKETCFRIKLLSFKATVNVLTATSYFLRLCTV